MTIIDANVLLNAVNRAAVVHQRARGWLDAALAGPETVGFPWVSILAFLRISTHQRALSKPLSVLDARARLEDWLAQPVAVLVEPGPGHLPRVMDLLAEVGTAGNVTNDAHIAALAIE